MAPHLDRFDELVVTMEAVGEQIDEARQLVILLGSLSTDFDTLVSIIENTPSPLQMDVKEKLLKAEEKAKAKEDSEVAFKARVSTFKPRAGPPKHRDTSRGLKDGARKPKAKGYDFAGKCFVCGQVGHKAVT
ncbi:hypothetical protein PybrP1_000199 [[Pythium] brassicae (nom. inval.)]|nr:hypothetical protein PybrP1_000199 [[Pythium] brassicae (nom. inval.)]